MLVHGFKLFHFVHLFENCFATTKIAPKTQKHPCKHTFGKGAFWIDAQGYEWKALNASRLQWSVLISLILKVLRGKIACIHLSCFNMTRRWVSSANYVWQLQRFIFKILSLEVLIISFDQPYIYEVGAFYLKYFTHPPYLWSWQCKFFVTSRTVNIAIKRPWAKKIRRWGVFRKLIKWDETKILVVYKKMKNIRKNVDNEKIPNN